MIERAVDDVPAGAQAAAGNSPSPAFTDDSSTLLGLSHARTLTIRTLDDFRANYLTLDHEQREHYARLLRIGRPRPMPRHATLADLGVAIDARTGQPLMDPDDPTLQERDCDPDLVGIGPAEMANVLQKKAQEADDRDGEGPAYFAALMARQVAHHGHGGGKAARKKPSSSAGGSIVQRMVVESIEASIGSSSPLAREQQGLTHP